MFDGPPSSLVAGVVHTDGTSASLVTSSSDGVSFSKAFDNLYINEGVRLIAWF